MNKPGLLVNFGEDQIHLADITPDIQWNVLDKVEMRPMLDCKDCGFFVDITQAKVREYLETKVATSPLSKNAEILSCKILGSHWPHAQVHRQPASKSHAPSAEN